MFITQLLLICAQMGSKPTTLLLAPMAVLRALLLPATTSITSTTSASIQPKARVSTLTLAAVLPALHHQPHHCRQHLSM